MSKQECDIQNFAPARVSVHWGIEGGQAATTRELCHIESQEEPIPILEEFLDVFPEDLPRLSPDLDVEFAIEVISNTAPI